MIDEGELRRRFPEIAWDQPVAVNVACSSRNYHVCRYCIAMHGLRAEEIGNVEFAFSTRARALDHIESAHHD